jgi:hypothetical protein
MFGMSAATRLDRDVFSIVLEGINNIGMSGRGGMFGDTPLVGAKDLTGAYSQTITRAHERGIKVFGAAVTPFQGADYYSADKDKGPSECQRVASIFIYFTDESCLCLEQRPPVARQSPRSPIQRRSG